MSLLKRRDRAHAAVLTGTALMSFACAADVWAVNPVTWDFLIQTTGNNATWTSPTAVDTEFPQYEVAYQIDRVVVGTNLLDIDLVAEGILDAEDLTGSAIYGTLPISLFTGSVDENGNHADITLGLDANGQGYASITNVTFSTFFGMTVQSLLIEGEIDVTAVPEPASAALLMAAGGVLLARARRTEGRGDGQ